MDMTHKEPLVSVITTVYNAEKYFEKAAESVLNQTLSSIEYIIVNDASTDSTSELAHKTAAAHDNVTVIDNDKNMGAAYSRNTAISLAKGKYIAFIDGDDIWYNTKLEKQTALLEKTGADIAFCSYEYINEDGEKLNKGVIAPDTASFDKMLCDNVIGFSTVTARVDTMMKYRFSDEYYHEDYALWMKMLSDGCTAVGISGILVLYRRHRNSRSGNKLKAAKHRYLIYRNALGMTRAKSIWLLTQYAVNGVKKHLFGKIR